MKWTTTVILTLIAIAITALLPQICGVPPRQVLPTQNQQSAIMFSEKDCSGESQALNSIPRQDLKVLNFDDKAQSVRSVGIWLFYTDVQNHGDVEFDFQPREACFNFRRYGGKFSSVRSAGFFFDWTFEAMALYQDDWFRGPLVGVTSNQISQITNSAGSLIINGNLPWELFPSFDFQGNSVCIGLRDFNPSFICDITEVFSSPVKSVRSGCAPPVNENETRQISTLNCNTRFDPPTARRVHGSPAIGARIRNKSLGERGPVAHFYLHFILIALMMILRNFCSFP